MVDGEADSMDVAGLAVRIDGEEGVVSVVGTDVSGMEKAGADALRSASIEAILDSDGEAACFRVPAEMVGSVMRLLHQALAPSSVEEVSL